MSRRGVVRFYERELHLLTRLGEREGLEKECAREAAEIILWAKYGIAPRHDERGDGGLQFKRKRLDGEFYDVYVDENFWIGQVQREGNRWKATGVDRWFTTRRQAGEALVRKNEQRKQKGGEGGERAANI